MRFEMRNLFLDVGVTEFSDVDAPDWLTSENTVKGSTMDMRWFWRDHVLTLPVGGVVETDFQKITRVE